MNNNSIKKQTQKQDKHEQNGQEINKQNKHTQQLENINK